MYCVVSRICTVWSLVYVLASQIASTASSFSRNTARTLASACAASNFKFGVMNRLGVRGRGKVGVRVKGLGLLVMDGVRIRVQIRILW